MVGWPHGPTVHLAKFMPVAFIHDIQIVALPALHHAGVPLSVCDDNVWCLDGFRVNPKLGARMAPLL